MLVKITTYNNTVYKFASKTTDTTDGIYLGRLRDDLSLTSMASVSGTVPASQNLTIYNADNYIAKSENFWGASLLLTQENGLTWLGKVTFFNFDSDGNLYLTASEKGAPELELQLPDEVRQVYTIDNNFHQSSTTMTIPLAIGGSTANPLLLPTILIDKTEGVYLICVGEIRSILKVYNGTEELPSSAYQAYTGTASQALHPGFAYVKINEDYRTNADGSYAEINVELVGLKLGTHTEAECRNGARFLLWFLKTASSGINGWGCGIPESEIDVASFNSAISLVDLMGLKLDGIMWLRQSAQNWIDQICQAIHGSYSIGSNGKRKLTIDYAGAASKKTFNASKIILNKYGKDSYVSTVYNKGILSYGYNPITGLFMQSAQFENADSIAQIGEQKFVGESYLIQDASTALAILEYNCKKSLSSAEAIDFTTDDLSTDLFAGDIITLDRSDIGITGEFQITSISTSDTKSEITAVRFDRSVFTVTGSHSNVNWGNEKNITPALTPAQATNLLLSTGFDINQDGTGNPYISGTFTVPEGGWLAAAVQYGIGANPTNFTELALITEGRFKIQPVNVGTIYTIRVRMITATGHSDYITGQITSTGDTVPPAIPTIVLNSTDKTVIVKCAIDNPPSDMGGFQIWRKKRSEEVFTLVGNVAANFGYASFPDHVETFVEYDYKAKSYDRSGNLSDFSNVVSITPTGLEATELAATALKIPTGSILNINAKGSTTESIKTANGVIDGSGFGHHGQANTNVEIINDNELGQCFNFSSGGNITLPASAINAAFNGLDGITFIIGIKNWNSNNNNATVLEFLNSGYTANIIQITPSGYINIGGRRAAGDNYESHMTESTIDHNYHQICGQYDYQNAKVYIYVDGEKVLDSSYQTSGKFTFGVTQAMLVRGSNYTGVISEFKIYPRILSNVEIKSLKMILQEAIMQRVTADLIGANAVKAIHLDAGSVTANAVGTNQIITDSANIANAVITNAKISTIESEKINAGNLQAGAVTASKLSVTGYPYAKSCSCLLNPQGVTDTSNGSYIPDSSGHSKYGQMYNIAKINNLTNSNFMRGEALVFNGTSSYIQTVANIKPSSTNALSFYFKIRPTGNSHDYQFIFDTAGGGNRIGFGYTKALKWYISTSTGDHISSTGPVLNSDYTVCITLTGEVCVAYVNNVQVLSFSCSYRTITTALVIGARNNILANTYGFQGYMSEFGIFEENWNSDTRALLQIYGADTESGQITSDRLATNAVQSRTAPVLDSNNRFTTNASMLIDLSGGGAIHAKNFAVDNSGNAYFKGSVEATSGSIGNFILNNGMLIGSATSNATFVGLSYDNPGFQYATTMSPGALSEEYWTITNNVKTISERAQYTQNRVYLGAVLSGNQFQSETTLRAGYLSLKESQGAYGAVAYMQANSTSSKALDVKGTVYVNGSIVHGSDRDIKSDVKAVSTLNKLKKLNLFSWKYDDDKLNAKKYLQDFEKFKKGELDEEPEKQPIHHGSKGNETHIGPMAQDFNELFSVNNKSKDTICDSDLVGVALRAIQELAQQVDDLKRQVRSYKRILNISDQQIAEERNARAVRLLEVTKARQAKRELAILARNSEIENSVIEPILEAEKLANNSESGENHDY